ncbi:Non-specific serine/threonine protein kinase [Bertholletia excelsa]
MEMLKLSFGLLISALLFSLCYADNCDCGDEGFWSFENIIQGQRVGDILIAIAYFSIPIELLYFVTCSTIPFKWVIVEFMAFIILCGMTHFLSGWTYGPQPFQLMLAITIFKALTALVSFITSVSLFILIPWFFRVKLREFFLKKKTCDLNREVRIIKKQREAGQHVRMLTREIRKTLDRHTILYTTLVELSKTLDLQSCAVWMPNLDRTEMNLTHELKEMNVANPSNVSIPYSDPDVREIKTNGGVKLLGSDSALALKSSEGYVEPGAVAAIRMPMLRVSNFRHRTRERAEIIQACYAILVLVLPFGKGRFWSNLELEMVKAVADQVAVAISHAAILEESQLMRKQLEEQNRDLQQAKYETVMANKARNLFQKIMNDNMRIPMHTILGLVLMMKDEKLSGEQQILVDTMLKASNVLTNLINDATDFSDNGNGGFALDMESFGLHSMLKEAACIVKSLCVYNGYGFVFEVEKSLPNHVMGDERRVFQVIVHMVGHLLNGGSGGGDVNFKVFSDSGRTEERWASWEPSLPEGYVCVRFELGITVKNSRLKGSTSGLQFPGRSYHRRFEEGLSFSVCKQLVQMMQGNIYEVSNSGGFDQCMRLVLCFQIRPSIVLGVSGYGDSSGHPTSNSLFRGLRILVVDNDDMNRIVTEKLLQKMGCVVSTVALGYECLAAVGPASSSFQIILLEIHMPDLDGLELAMKIRKSRSHNRPLMIALTASSDEDVFKKCFQVGINGVIRKPVLLQGIKDELRRVLQANKAV